MIGRVNPKGKHNTNDNSNVYGESVLFIQSPGRARETLAGALCSGFRIRIADNCENASTLLERDSSFDLIILDLSCDNAFDFIRNIKELHGVIPILALSDASMSQETHALEAGVDDIQRRPMNIAMIKHRIRMLFSRQETLEALRNSTKHKDELTGLFRRKVFITLSKEIMTNHDENKSFVMMCFDVKDFRNINSAYGSDNGDRVLQRIGDVLRQTTDENHSVLMRSQADRFYAFMVEDSGRINLICDSIGKIDFGLPVPVTVHIGIYKSSKEESIQEMMNKALISMEWSTKNSTDKAVWFDEKMAESVAQQYMIKNGFIKAIRENQISVYFQPKINYENKHYVGAEALVRWIHPIMGLMMPDKFIPVLEKEGLITELDLFVLSKVCEYQRKWKDEGLVTLRISVNFSPLDFKTPDFAEQVISIIENYGLNYKDIRFEITETSYINDEKFLVAFVEAVHRKGFLIDMDDFGSGYSSLNMLNEINVDAIKLDIRMTNKNNNHRSEYILGAIVRMARWLKIDVLAEGVETENQAEYLHNLGCVYMQGYLFGKPMPALSYREKLVENEEKIGCLRDVAPNEIFEKGVTLENISTMEMNDIMGLLKTVGAFFPLVICQNYSRNSYYIMEYDDFMNKSASTNGKYDDLIRVGADTFHPDERQSFLSTFRRGSILSLFAEGQNRFTHIGRQISDTGKYYWVQTNVFVYRDVDGDIKGYTLSRSVDDEYKSRSMSEGFLSVISAMSKAFVGVFEIDIAEGLMKEIHTPIHEREYIMPVSNFLNSLKMWAEHDLLPGEFEKNEWFWNFDNITERVNEGINLTTTFQTRSIGWQMARLVELERDADGNVTKVLWISQDVNEKVSNEKTYSAVRESFIDSYDISYQIDVDNDICYEIKSDIRLQKLIPPVGNVHEVIHNFISYCVDAGYQTMMYDFINLNTLEERISGKKYIMAEYSGQLFSWLRATIVPIAYDTYGKIKQFVFGVNIIEKKKLPELDSMTGLLNSGTMQKQIEDLFTSGDISNGVMLVIDIDNLKVINDTFGHQAGTDVILGISKCMREIFRSTDIIGRYGGDEFVVFMRNFCNDEDMLREKVHQLFEAISSMKIIHDYTVTCSVGAAFTDETTFTFKELFNRADNALYSAKNNGRNDFVIYRR